ncbi:MAG: T9SS type A sorting domain-containing protein, partial [Bacteroidales bacterium]
NSLSFRVIDDNSLRLENFYCFPNPVSDKTQFYFETNISATNLDLKIEIFSINGTKVAEMVKNSIYAEGFRIGPVEWNGRSFNGAKLAKGLYFARLQVSSIQGNEVAATKIIIL